MNSMKQYHGFATFIQIELFPHCKFTFLHRTDFFTFILKCNTLIETIIWSFFPKTNNVKLLIVLIC